MSKLPAFQFYPGDWRKDPSLNVCSRFACGLLIDLLCVCFESACRGALVLPSGVPMSRDQIFRAVCRGETREEFETALNELIDAGVMKVHDSGYLYNSRMVRDEEVRQGRVEAGSKGGSKRQANSKQTLKQTSSKPEANTQANHQAKRGSSSSSSTSVIKGGFDPPTVEQVRDYCQERKNDIDAQAFVDHYTANGWMRGKNKIKDWRACVRTWEQTRKTQSGQLELDDWPDVLSAIKRTYQPDIKNRSDVAAVLSEDQFRAAESVGLARIANCDQFDKLTPSAYRSARRANHA